MLKIIIKIYSILIVLLFLVINTTYCIKKWRRLKLRKEIMIIFVLLVTNIDTLKVLGTKIWNILLLIFLHE